MYRGNPGRRTTVGATWRKLQAKVYSSTTVCWLCGGEVDRTVRRTHPMAPSVDHAIPKSVAPQLALVLSNLRLAHYGCNSSRGDRLSPTVTSTQSRRW